MNSHRAVALALLLSVALPGCDGKPHHHEEGEHAEHGEKAHEKKGHGEEHEHEEGAETLHVQESMLRDLHLTTQPAEARVAGDMATALGELRVNEDRYSEVGTAIEARAVRVLAAEGDVVKAGQPLVELDSIDVGKARAALTSADARAALARATAERKRALVAEQIAAPKDVQAAEAELTQAEAELRAAEQTLQALGSVRGAGGRFALSSSIDGTVLERHVLPGRRVDASQPLFVVADLSLLWLVVHVYERDALSIKEGATAQVSFAALPGRTFEGRVSRIGSRVDPVARTIDVRVDVRNDDRLLRPGMSATAQVARGEATAKLVAVPTQAVQRLLDGWAVFVPEKREGGFEIRKIGRGRDLDGEVEIVSGLEAGEVVVVDGAFLLKAQFDKSRGGSEEHHH
jgi:cobalt-zinc-cadmium efflux system membrane fusion protein